MRKLRIKKQSISETLKDYINEFLEYINRYSYLKKRYDELSFKYNELLMQVHRKFPDETRHETAKRYIMEAEKYGDCNIMNK